MKKNEPQRYEQLLQEGGEFSEDHSYGEYDDDFDYGDDFDYDEEFDINQFVEEDGSYGEETLRVTIQQIVRNNARPHQRRPVVMGI